MRNWITAFATYLLPQVPQAQDTGLERLETTDAGYEWPAMSRLGIDGTGFCTGLLSWPTLVLIAAHYLFDKATNQRIYPARIELLAGWYLVHALAYRAARQTVVHSAENMTAAFR